MPETKTVYVKQYDKKANELANKVIRAAESGDRAKHWEAIHDLLRHQNRKACKEQDKVAKDCQVFRDEKLIKKTKNKQMGIRFGVSIPPMTWNALVEADVVAFGESVLVNSNKEDYADIQGSNVIVKDLEKAFPQYRVS